MSARSELLEKLVAARAAVKTLHCWQVVANRTGYNLTDLQLGLVELRYGVSRREEWGTDSWLPPQPAAAPVEHEGGEGPHSADGEAAAPYCVGSADSHGEAGELVQ